MYCHQCGKEIADDSKFCPYCGTQLKGETTQGYYQPLQDQPQYQYQQTPYSRIDDEPNFGYALLAFFIPIVGIILFAIWNHEYPLRARSCLKGFITGIVVWVITVCCLFAAIGTASNDYDYYRYEYDTYFNSVVEVIPYE